MFVAERGSDGKREKSVPLDEELLVRGPFFWQQQAAKTHKLQEHVEKYRL